MTISFKKFNTLLKRKHLFKKELAEKAALHPSTLSRISSGSGNIRITTLHALCKALNCDIGDVLEFTWDK